MLRGLTFCHTKTNCHWGSGLPVHHWELLGTQRVLSWMPYLFPHKLSVSPPCGTVLTGGMHADLSVQIIIIHFIWLQVISRHQQIRLWRFCSKSTSLSLTLLLCFSLWGKHGTYEWLQHNFLKQVEHLWWKWLWKLAFSPFIFPCKSTPLLRSHRLNF